MVWVRVSVHVQSPKEPELNSHPRVHVATGERTRKVEKGKCTEAVAIFAGEQMTGKGNPDHGDVTLVEFELCHVLQSLQHISLVQLNCNQHNLLEQCVLGCSSISVLIHRGWIPYKPSCACPCYQSGEQHIHPPPVIWIPTYKQGLGGVCAWRKSGDAAISQQNKSNYLY